MKAICIIGSPRESGSTAFLVERIMDGMTAAGVQVRRLSLGQLNIGYCQGCRECETTRRCIQRDDMDQLLGGILESEIVLLASPSYWGDVTGQMKVFIDRSLPLCNAATGETPVPEGKVGIAVALRAGRSTAENKHLVDTFEHYFGHLGIRMAASLTVEGIDTLVDMENSKAELEKAYDLGHKVVRMFQGIEY